MRLRLIAASGAALLLIGCGSGAVSTDETAPPPQETATNLEVPPSLASKPPASVPPLVPTKGANAAPEVGTYSLPYDQSQEAADAFTAWWRYEVQKTEDVQRGAQLAYDDGKAVCLARQQGAGPESIQTVLNRDMGWTKGGAVAIYAAALRSICTQYDFGTAQSDGVINGYKTYFDEQVNLSYPLAVQAVQPFGLAQPPNRIDVGWLGKFACHYMTQTGTSVGLLDHLQTYGSWLGVAADPRIAQAMTRQVVTHMCPGHMDKVFTW